ncbi:MAG: VTT domain-containing protein [Candidatus Paceibacterota bacterium]
MITSFITLIEETLLPLGAIGVFTASVLEEVLAPVPSALVQMGAGFIFLSPYEDVSLAFAGTLLGYVIIPASLGVALGSLVVYYIGYYAGKPTLERWGKYFGFTWHNVKQGHERFRRTQADATVLFFLRVAPIIPSVAISAVCGVIRMKLWRYLLYTFLGTMIRVAFLAMIGWQVGNLYREYYDIVDQFESVVLLVALTLFFLFVLYKLLRKRFSGSL